MGVQRFTPIIRGKVCLEAVVVAEIGGRNPKHLCRCRKRVETVVVVESW
ncbi:hypothetical protein DP44_5292 [Burkholderia pseudomallei]|nr:hypothetical protein DP44_5292 [Burkholderia pseudomallei]